MSIAIATPATARLPRTETRRATVPNFSGAVDTMRVASAAAIVWQHSPGAPGKLGCGVGLIVFIILSFMHASQPSPLLVVVKRRFQRIIIPWAFWWCVYAVVMFRIGDRPPAMTSLWNIIAWPSIHLWYMPFLFIHSIGLQACRPFLKALSTSTKEVIAVALGVAGILAISLYRDTELPGGAGIWIHSMPAIFLGLALGSCMKSGSHTRHMRLAGIVGIVALASGYIARQGCLTEGIAYGFGTALVALTVLPLKRWRFATKLALLTPGIYLIHPLMFLLVWKFVAITRITASQPPFWAFLIVGMVGGAVVTHHMKRHSLTKMLV